MTPAIDESNLTAYALGELSGPERTAVAAHLAGSEESRRFVADVRATAHVLADELARESYGGLTDLQHAVIEKKLESMLRLPQARRRNVVRHDRMVLVMSLAASIVIVSG